MNEHVHGCLSCRPEMVPDFDRADPRYHRYDDKCPSYFRVLLNGVPIAYTHGAFEGPEGWVLFVGLPSEANNVHCCQCCSGEICVEPRFGVVTVEHLAPHVPPVGVVVVERAEVIR